MTSKSARIDEAIAATEEHDYLRALTLFLDIYNAPVRTAKDARGLSYFGLVLALVQKKYKEGIDLTRRAIELEFYNGAHYANLTRIYAAAGNRKKAVEAAEEGLRVAPESEHVLAARAELGNRARPALPFLDRSHPINITLGQSRHAKRLAEAEAKKKR